MRTKDSICAKINELTTKTEHIKTEQVRSKIVSNYPNESKDLSHLLTETRIKISSLFWVLEGGV